MDPPKWSIVLIALLASKFVGAQLNNHQSQQNLGVLPLSSNNISPSSSFDPDIYSKVSKSVLELAYKIGNRILPASSSKVEIFSPVSIASALNLVLLGSRGRTYQEIAQLLGYDKDSILTRNPSKIHEELGYLLEDLVAINPIRQRPKEHWKNVLRQHKHDDGDEQSADIDSPFSDHFISVANGLFIQNGYNIRPDYKAVVQSIYKSELKNLNFAENPGAAAAYINRWVDEKTYGKIKEIISDSIHPETRVIVASALYFKAKWEENFIHGATQFRNFYPDGENGRIVSAELMAHGGLFPFYDSKEHDCRIMGFPYKRNQTTLYVILPNNSNRQKLIETQRRLTAEAIDEIIEKLQLKTSVILFPKLHVTSQINLKAKLQTLGINALFDAFQSDLSLVSDVGYPQQSVPIDNRNRPQASTANSEFSFPDNQAPPQSQNQAFQNQPVFGPSDQQAFSPIYPSTSFGSNNPPPRSTRRPPNQSTDQAANSQVSLSSNSQAPRYPSIPLDRYPTADSQLPASMTQEQIWSRIGTDGVTRDASENNVPTRGRYQRDVTYKVESEKKGQPEPLRLKDFILNKRISKPNPGKKGLRRSVRQANDHDISQNLLNLERLKQDQTLHNPGLFADEVIHKIDLTINEKGTEGGAVTAVTLTRSGTQVVFRVDTPFLILIRHDSTKLPLFYGAIFEPVNAP